MFFSFPLVNLCKICISGIWKATSFEASWKGNGWKGRYRKRQVNNLLTPINNLLTTKGNGWKGRYRKRQVRWARFDGERRERKGGEGEGREERRTDGKRKVVHTFLVWVVLYSIMGE